MINREELKEKALDDLEGTLIEVMNMLKPGVYTRDMIINMLGHLKNLEDKEKLYKILKHSYVKEGKPEKDLSGAILEFYITSVNRVRVNFIEFLNDLSEETLSK